MNMLPMISYAQNYEDVLLKRAFPINSGFYIDVGAALPTLDSVTKHFSVVGWRGINIEPQPHLFKILNEQRPKDINIAGAVGTKSGEMDLTIFPDAWGWATLNEKFNFKPGMKSEKIKVKVQSLNSILEENKIDCDIEFLKVDVEGNEFDVIRSINLRKWKPKVVILESVTQMELNPDYKYYDIYMYFSGYKFVLFDGLNRYYVRKDLKDIAKKLSLPVNFTDSFVQQSILRKIPKETRLERWKKKREEGFDISEYERFEEIVDQIQLEERITYE